MHPRENARGIIYLVCDPRDLAIPNAYHWRIDVDAATVEGAVRGTRFDRLQAAEDETGFANAVASDRRFFRRGRAQVWRHDLSPSQVARIEARHGDVMARFGYL